MVNERFRSRFGAQSPVITGGTGHSHPGQARNPHRGHENASLQGEEVPALTSLGARISPARRGGISCGSEENPLLGPAKALAPFGHPENGSSLGRNAQLSLPPLCGPCSSLDAPDASSPASGPVASGVRAGALLRAVTWSFLWRRHGHAVENDGRRERGV